MVALFYKWLSVASLHLSVFLWIHSVGLPGGVLRKFHPFHVSVTEVNHNATDKTLEISCKIFTDDFSDALAKKYKVKVDLVHPTDKAAMDKIVSDYISNHLQIKTDNKTGALNYVGFEVENEATYVYMQVNDVTTVKKADVTNTILYDLFTDQTEIVHVIVAGNRKSVKVDYPNNEASFQF